MSRLPSGTLPNRGADAAPAHLLVTALDRLIRNETVLDAVEDLIGPNILCWTSLFFTKDAHDPAFVSGIRIPPIGASVLPRW